MSVSSALLILIAMIAFGMATFPRVTGWIVLGVVLVELVLRWIRGKL